MIRVNRRRHLSLDGERGVRPGLPPIPNRFFAFAIEHRLVNAENFRRFRQTGDPFQDFAQMSFLQFFQRDQRAEWRQVFPGWSSRFIFTAQFSREIIRQKFLPFGQNDGALVGVAQLAPVARLRIRPDADDGFGRKSFELAAALVGEEIFTSPL